MNREDLEKLGLFTLPPQFRPKTRQEKQEEAKLAHQYLHDFQDEEESKVVDGVDEEERLLQEREEEDLKRRRERHNMQLETTRNLYISEIMRRENKSSFSSAFDLFDDTSEEDIQRRKEAAVKNEDFNYLQRLEKAVKVCMDQEKIQLLEVEEFPLRIAYVDKFLKSSKQWLVKLRLVSCFLTAGECLVISQNPKMKAVRKLDLSCNFITVQGLLYLVDPTCSQICKLTSLKLFQCNIDHDMAYLVSNDKLEKCKTLFKLQKLNLSCNSLGSFLNYVLEFDLINTELRKLTLISCSLNDEHIVSLANSKKLDKLEYLDLGNNNIEQGFPQFMKYLKENCEFLSVLQLCWNKSISLCANLQVAKAKKNSGLSLLEKLDLTQCLKGDKQASQIAQSSYYKDLKYLSLKKCFICNGGALELFQSKNLRSLEVLILRKNRLTLLQGPFSDLDEKEEGQPVMKLKLLDVRENKLKSVVQPEAKIFLEETVVLMWDNPFSDKKQLDLGFYFPSLLNKTLLDKKDSDQLPFFNPNHIFRANEVQRQQYEELFA